MAARDWLDPLHDAAGMRAVDDWAISEQGVPALRLMEAAGRAVAGAVRSASRPGPVRVVCGKGNNGGDGLVAARLLAESGFEAEVLLAWPASDLGGDAKANYERLDSPAHEIGESDWAEALAGSGCVVDAIFGTGFDGAPRRPALAAIEAINEFDGPVVAADIASGVDASTGEAEGVAVGADVTVSFHSAKLGQRIAPGKRSSGDVRIADIGIPAGSGVEPAGGEITSRVLDSLTGRSADSTKFTSGEVVVAGGSRGLTGSVALCARAAIRAGAGYAMVAVPAELETVFELKLTEVMSRGAASAAGAFAPGADAEILTAADGAGALVLGPGFGRSESALEVARAVAAEAKSALVLDADGLNAHADRLAELASRPGETVITPHAGELGRLLGRSSDEIGARRLDSAREAAKLGRCVVVLKGDDTIVADHDGEQPGVAISVLPAPGLATAGTGDVLAGTIGALIARGLDPFTAAAAAVWVNTTAGRLAAKHVGSADSVIASDVVDAIPRALGAGR